MATFTADKDPDEVIDYTFDWSALMETAETISSQTTTSPDSSITVDSSNISGETVVVFLSAGTLGQTGQVLCEVTTSGGRTFQQTVYTRIRSR